MVRSGAAAALKMSLRGYHQRPYGNCCRDAAGRLVVRPQGSAHKADSAALQLLHNHLLLSGAKILKAIHVDPDGALRPQCEAQSRCQA